MSKSKSEALLENIQWVQVPGSTKPELHAAVVEFTPTMAQEWLEHKNTRNRPLGKGDIRKYCLAMLSGEWELNGESLVLDDKGRLVNGQHRLAAIVLAGESDTDITVPVLVILGVKSKAFDTFDQGRSRSLSDVLSVNNEENANTLAAALRLLWLRLSSAKVAGGKAFRSATAVNLLEEHKTLQDSVAFFVGTDDSTGLEQQTKEDADCDSKFSRICSLAHAACLHYLMLNSGVEDAVSKVPEFWRGLAFGTAEDGQTSLPTNDPRKKARTTLLKSASSETKLTRDGKIGVLIKAWQAFLDGEELSRITIAKGEYPRIGGLDSEPEEDDDADTQDDDTDVHVPDEPEPEAKPAKVKAKRKAKTAPETVEETTEVAGN